MNDIEIQMIRKAKQLHKKIFPCAQKMHFRDCFTRNNDAVFFWYNTEDHSTHVIAESLQEAPGNNSAP